jgi:Plastocyanin
MPRKEISNDQKYKLLIMKKIIISLFVISFGLPGLCTTWTVTNGSFVFSPATITIITGDDVSFVLDPIHNVVEVSQSTWNANGNTPLAGGFQLPFGGGLVSSSQLNVGTHYYVCSPHASSGMKGMIIVQNTTGIAESVIPVSYTVYPNPFTDFLTITTRNNLAGTQYFITDQAGRQITNGKLTDDTTPVDISRLSPGIYLIQIAGQRRLSFKVIKN